MAAYQKQDMPPPGGYGPIQYDRVPLKGFLSGKKIACIFAGTTIVGHLMLYFRSKYYKRYDIERRSAEIAIQPLLVAERDRVLLKHMRKMREKEAELMADVPHWKVGTCFGEPVYKSKLGAKYMEPGIDEIYVHTPLEINNAAYWIPHVT